MNATANYSELALDLPLTSVEARIFQFFLLNLFRNKIIRLIISHFAIGACVVFAPFQRRRRHVCCNCSKIYRFRRHNTTVTLYILCISYMSLFVSDVWWTLIGFEWFVEKYFASQYHRSSANISIFAEDVSQRWRKHCDNSDKKNPMNENLSVFLLLVNQFQWRHVHVQPQRLGAAFGQWRRFSKIIYSKMSPNEQRECDSCVFRLFIFMVDAKWLTHFGP